MGSGASSHAQPTRVGTTVSGAQADDLLKVSLDSPEYVNGKPDLRYTDEQGRTIKVEAEPEEVIGCFTTLDKSGRVTSVPGRLFRLVLPIPATPEKPVESAAATRETSAGSTESNPAANAQTAAADAAPTSRSDEENNMADSRLRRWFFYNDTKEYNMVVTAYFGAYTQLRVLGMASKMWREMPSGLVIAELIIPPLKTLPFVEGLISDGYDIRFKALKA